METFKKIFKILLKILNIFFILLGVFFAALIAGAIYFYITDPFNVRPIIEALIFNDSDEISSQFPLFLDNTPNDTSETGGININDLPKQITPQLEKCLIEKLGVERIKEIGSGGMPSVNDFLKAKPCLTE